MKIRIGRGERIKKGAASQLFVLLEKICRRSYQLSSLLRLIRRRIRRKKFRLFKKVGDDGICNDKAERGLIRSSNAALFKRDN